MRGISIRWAALALAAAGCAAGIALGNWQTRRAAEKTALARELAATLRDAPVQIGAGRLRPGELVNRHVEATGVFAAARTVYLDNRNRGGRPGYEVVTPLVLAPSAAVLVQRGWIERGARESLRTPEGRQRVEGIALEHLPRAFGGGNEKGPVRQNLDIEAYAKETGLALQPIAIQQRNDNGDGLARDWPAPDFGVDTHRAYALQWYSLAALSAALGLAFSFRRVAEG